MLSRPSDTGHTPFGDIFYSESPDLIHWGPHRHVMSRTDGWQAYRGLEKLGYVYSGNVWGGNGEDTVCPSCGETVIARAGFAVSRVSVKDGKCEYCGAAVRVVGT